MRSTQSPTSPLINATVMASAGTGKTWLLVSRLLRLLLHGAPADTILAITFTRKAAAEMQTRLSERLLNLAAADDDALAAKLEELSLPADNATLTRARQLYEELLLNNQRVRTTTFHAFCQEILRRFPLEADVPPGFELLEGSGELVRIAWEMLLEQATQFPDGQTADVLAQLLDYCGSQHGLEQALFSFVEHRSDWWSYTHAKPSPVHFAVEQLRSQLQLSHETTALQRYFNDAQEQALVEYCELLRQHPIKGHMDRLNLLSEGRNSDKTAEERFAYCREALLTRQEEPRSCKASKAQAANMGEEGQQRFMQLHQQLAIAVIETLDRLAAEETLKASHAWFIAGSQLLDNYQQIKAERRLLDFTDLEWRAYQLLHQSDNAHWVQYKLDQRIDHLLVDEFQDTNPTQWHLLQPLLREMAAGSAERHRSVFLVGDSKQSIYRFRRAEPRLFTAAHEWLEQHLGAEGHPLHISWRSAPAIMQGVNQLFADAGPMAETLRDFTPHETHLKSLWGSVTALPLIPMPEGSSGDDEVVGELRNPLHQPRVVDTDKRYRLEGEMIAAEITRLIHAKTPVGDRGSARAMHYGDIMILVRSRAHVSEYEGALRRAGVPYLGAARGTLLESLEVRDLVALLEVLITPYNNLALAQVLRSPLFALDDEALLQLAAMENGTGNWFQRLEHLATEGASPALQRAWQLLSHWHAQVGKLPIHDLLDRIFNEGNVLDRYQAAYPSHLRSRCEANLTRFVELALGIDSGRYPSLGHFLSRLAEMREHADEAPDEAPGGEQERVRIMTIHASKGLEAPVVFIADSARGRGQDRPFRTLVEWPAASSHPTNFLLVGKRGQQPPFTREVLEREMSEENREDANLLYVALTRARQHLYLSACAPRRGDSLGWYGAIREALDPESLLTLETACRLESGTPPPLTEPVRGPRLPATGGTVPGELSQPLNIALRWQEIAPSRERHRAAATADIDEDGRQRGIAIHRLLELLTADTAASWQSASSQVAQELGLRSESPEYQEWVSEVRSLFDETALQQLLLAPQAMNEVPIIYQQGDTTVHGVIDRLVLQEDEIWIIDYKTHRAANRQNMDAYANTFQRQLRYYADGVKRLWPQHRIRSFLLFTHCRVLYELE